MDIYIDIRRFMSLDNNEDNVRKKIMFFFCKSFHIKLTNEK